MSDHVVLGQKLLIEPGDEVVIIIKKGAKEKKRFRLEFAKEHRISQLFFEESKTIQLELL